MKIVLLNKEMEEKYDDFLLQSEKTLFYTSIKYKNLITKLLDSEECYFLAIDDDNNIIGALPSIMKRSIDGKYKVLNSLPFYGSNGAIIEYKNNSQVKEVLIKEFEKFAIKNQCCASTIITSPFERDNLFYNRLNYDFIDERVGQVTDMTVSTNNIEENLMGLFHYKTRNAIRKAKKNNIKIDSIENKENLRFLYKVHCENMKDIGGISKPKDFFDLIPVVFEYDKDYKVYVAYLGETMIAALLVFYFNKTVEYFTPVVVKEFRSFQPLSILIFEAMKDSVQRGFRWWNWGGTWKTQDGVYEFKKKWGTEDKIYHYYNKIYDKKIINKSKNEILDLFSYFYVIPFNVLKEERM